MAERIAVGEIPSLHDLAGAAALSRFHFHRVYRLVTGETTSQTMARLRLARGVNAVRSQKVSITEAAFEAGYGSSQAFAKALRQHLQQSLSSLRKDPERLAVVIDQLRTHDGSDYPVSVEIASLEPFEVLAVRTVGRYPDVADTYTSLFREIGGAERVRAILGIPHGDSEDGLAGDLTFDCGFLLRGGQPKPSSGQVLLEVVGGTYLLGRHVGSFARLPEVLNALYAQIVAADEVAFGDRSCVLHYLDDPEQTEERNLRTDVYVPLDLC